MIESIQSIDDFVPQFCCHFFANNSTEKDCFDSKQNSYLRQNQLKWLFEKNNNYCNYWSNERTIRLFELTIDSNDLTANEMKILFTFVKKYLNELRSDSMTRSGNNRNIDSDYDYCKLRNKICVFLAYLRRRLFEICVQSSDRTNGEQMVSNSENSFCVLLIKQIKCLLLFIGRLSQMSPQLVRLAISSEPKASIYNYFHSCLDIWWTAIEMTYILDQNTKICLKDCALVKEEMSGSELCPQTIRLVVFDLTVLSANRLNATKQTFKYDLLPMFDCLCVKEMFVLVRHVFNASNNSVNNDKFFDLIFSTLNSFGNSNSNETLSINDFKIISMNVFIEKPFLHFIWFVTNIVQTFNYDISGQFAEQLSADPIPSALLKKIIQFLKQNDSAVNESELSAIVLFCLKSIRFWRPNTDILLPFTEYFLKNLNQTYKQTSVEELQVIPKSGAKWSQIIKENSIFNERNNFFSENSFNLFLSLMSEQLSRVFTTCDSKSKLLNWLKLKGKLMANLQSKRLEKLDEMGVLNLFSFYLVLIHSNHEIWTDIIDKIMETIEELVNRNTSNRLELIIKFLFTSLNIKPKSISDEKISAFIGKTLNKLCEQRVQNISSDSVDKCFINTMNIYFDEMKSLLKSNNLLELSFARLLNIKFSVFSCLHIRPDEQLFVIHFISYLLNQINETLEHKDHEFEPNIHSVINTCFDAILPFVKQEIIHKNNNKVFAEIAFHFTKLSNSATAINRNEKFSDIFNNFINISRNNTEFLCNYLSLVIENSKLAECVTKDTAHISSSLISIWCRLLVTPDISQTSIDSLSYNLSLIIDELKYREAIELQTNCLDIFVSFVRNLMQKFFNCLPNERIVVIQSAHKYFNDMITTSEAVVKQNNLTLIAIKRIYEIISNLVSIGSQLLYIPFKPDCLLPKIIDSIVLPTNLSNEQKLQMNAIFQKAFPLFIQGFCKLQYNGNQYLERQIRRTIAYHLPLLTNRSNAFLSLKTDFEKRNISMDWTKLLFGTVVKNFLSNCESSPTPALIQFITDFCKIDLNDGQLIAVLAQALRQVLTADLRSKQSLFLLIESIIKIFSEKQNDKVLIDRVFVEFIETNLLNKSSLKRLFEVIRFVCQCCPHLFHELIGQINRSIESIEKKRNIGTDFILRNALREFANQTIA